VGQDVPVPRDSVGQEIYTIVVVNPLFCGVWAFCWAKSSIIIFSISAHAAKTALFSKFLVANCTVFAVVTPPATIIRDHLISEGISKYFLLS